MTGKPTYDELADALKETQTLYMVAIKHTYQTHDITRVMSNDWIIRRLELHQYPLTEKDCEKKGDDTA